MAGYPKRTSCPCTKMPFEESPGCACSRRPEEIKPIRKASIKSDEFNPQLYNFRLQQLNQGPRVRAPPFHVQLDHTIAVLWNMYHRPSTTPDVGHLQWAKHFLQRIRNNHGDMPKDVETVVKAIEDRMLSLYAELSKKPPYTYPTCCSTEPQHCQAKQSVTFTEMVKQKPPDAVQQLFCVDPMPLTESCSSHLACDCQTSKEEMAKYLKQKRAEGVRKIRAQLKQLQEIDEAMGNVSDSATDSVDGKALKQIESAKESTSTKQEEITEPAETQASQSERRVTISPPPREQEEGNLIDI